MPDAGFDPQPAPLPAGLRPDPLDQAARKVAVEDSQRAAVHVVYLEDAKACREQAVREATKLVMDDLEKVSARLVEANEALEAWGALDFLLLLEAERWGASTDGPPLGTVHSLILKAYQAGAAGRPWPSES